MPGTTPGRKLLPYRYFLNLRRVRKRLCASRPRAADPAAGTREARPDSIVSTSPERRDGRSGAIAPHLPPSDEIGVIDLFEAADPPEIYTGSLLDLSERSVHRFVEAAPRIVVLLLGARDALMGFRRAPADLLRRHGDLPIEPFCPGLRPEIQAADVDRAGDRLEVHVPLRRIRERRL